MSRARAIYSDRMYGAPRKPPRGRRAALRNPVGSRRFPKGLTLLVPVVLVSLAVGYVNFRAYREYLDEQHQNVELERQIENATRQNIELQEEIYYLKNDPATIENEARRFGLVRPGVKVSKVGEADEAEKSANRQTPTRK